MRRWKTAETELIGAIKGIKLKGSEYENLDVLNEGNPGLTDENGFLIVEPAENRNFVTPKHYYYSLPLDELYLNPNLAPNNPGGRVMPYIPVKMALHWCKMLFRSKKWLFTLAKYLLDF